MKIRLVATFVGLFSAIATAQVSAQGSSSSSAGDGKGRGRPVLVPVPKPAVVSSFVVQPKITRPGEGIDFVHAKGLQLPALAQRSELQAHYDLMDALQGRQQPLGPGGLSPGAQGPRTDVPNKSRRAGEFGTRRGRHFVSGLRHHQPPVYDRPRGS